MMDKSENVEMIDKFLENFVFSDVPYDVDYSAGYNERYERYVIRITVVVDVSKTLRSHANYDKDYSTQVSNMNDDKVFNDFLKYLGIPHNMIEIYIGFDYINDEFLDKEINLFKDMVQKEVSKTDSGKTVFADVRKSPEDYFYFEFEVGTDESLHDYPSVMHMQEYVYDLLDSGMFPNLSVISSESEIQFWFVDY
jgi:hypothetical protein